MWFGLRGTEDLTAAQSVVPLSVPCKAVLGSVVFPSTAPFQLPRPLRLTCFSVFCLFL